MKLNELVPTELPNWYLLRVLRSLKNVFQSKCSGAGAEVLIGSVELGAAVVDALRIDLGCLLWVKRT